MTHTVFHTQHTHTKTHMKCS